MRDRTVAEGDIERETAAYSYTYGAGEISLTT